jgi:uncharacterized membrane protein YdfJ with MMPL/SSD domain
MIGAILCFFTLIAVVVSFLVRLSLLQYVFKCGWLKSLGILLAVGVVVGMVTGITLLVLGFANLELLLHFLVSLT